MTIDDENNLNLNLINGSNEYNTNELLLDDHLLLDNLDNSFESMKIDNYSSDENLSENLSEDIDSSESENLSGDNNSVDDNAADILKEELLYSDDELFSDFDDTEGKI